MLASLLASARCGSRCSLPSILFGCCYRRRRRRRFFFFLMSSMDSFSLAHPARHLNWIGTLLAPSSAPSVLPFVIVTHFGTISGIFLKKSDWKPWPRFLYSWRLCRCCCKCRDKYTTITTNSVQGPPCDIDPDCEYHEDYLSEFKSMLVTKMRTFIDKDLANDPDCIKGRKKTVQVRNINIPV